jgi:hypothetical protein
MAASPTATSLAQKSQLWLTEERGSRILGLAKINHRSPILLSSVVAPTAAVQPTHAAPLVRLLACAPSPGLERYLERRKRGVSTLVLSLVWLVLAWHGSGGPR